MVCDPSPHPDADRSDFRFTLRRIDPQADAPFDRVGVDAERGERIGDPLFERMYEPPYIAPALFQIAHEIATPLTRPVIRICSTQAGPSPKWKTVGTGKRG